MKTCRDTRRMQARVARNERAVIAVQLLLLIGLLSSGDRASAQQQGPPPDCCPVQSVCCIGQWMAPVSMSISCEDNTTSGGPYCGDSLAACNVGGDEIGHAVMIPAGNWSGTSLAGKVLVWTRCDYAPARNGNGYFTYVWDPENPADTLFAVPVGTAALDTDDGPFCAGHAYVLDDTGNPKLVTVGGTDRHTPTPCLDLLGKEVGCGLQEAYWFDPLVTGPATAWDDGPQETNLERLWYPSVISYLDTSGPVPPLPYGYPFRPIVVGGSGLHGRGCQDSEETMPLGTIHHQYQKWWAIRGGLNTPWTVYTDDDWWHQYDRILLMSDGNVLAAGHEVICEVPIETPLENLNQTYGGNPVNRITITALTQTHDDLGTDPNAVATVGGLHYNNAVILHTLKNKSAWVTGTSNYDLDRIIVTGGTYEVQEDGGAQTSEIMAQPYTLEWVAGGWRLKNGPTWPRMYGNFVLLPDGSIVLVGGSDRKPPSQADAFYRSVAERLDPQGPPQPGTPNGVWTSLAQQAIVGTNTMDIDQTYYPGGQYATPRDYHSVAILLEDGSVALMGGQQPHGYFSAADSKDTVEIFKPPYMFQTQRLRITSAPTTIHYDSAFCITVNDPTRVRFACLIGIGAVTHHFDYGQRYVELMTRPCSAGGNVEILAPPLPIVATLAPAGYYLLFVVEVRDGGTPVPSIKGKFVRVTY